MNAALHPTIAMLQSNSLTMVVQQEIERAILAGANEYIMKPFDTEIIKSKFIQIGLIDVL